MRKLWNYHLFGIFWAYILQSVVNPYTKKRKKSPPQIHPLAFQVWTDQGEKRETIKTRSQNFGVRHANMFDPTQGIFVGDLYSFTNEQTIARDGKDASVLSYY